MFSFNNEEKASGVNLPCVAKPTIRSGQEIFLLFSGFFAIWCKISQLQLKDKLEDEGGD